MGYDIYGNYRPDIPNQAQSFGGSYARNTGFVPPSQAAYTPTQGGSLGIVSQNPGNTNASQLTGLEPGQADLGGFGGGLWSDLWGGIEGEKNRVHGQDLTLGQALLGGSTQQSVSDQRVYGPQDAIAQQYYPYVGNLLQQFGGDPSQLIAGFNPTQQLGQNLGINTALGLGGQTAQTNQAYSQALDPNSGFNSGLFQNVLQSQLNPYVRTFQNQLNPMAQNFGYQTNQLAQNFQNQLNQGLRNFTQDVLPSIRSEAVGVGQVGSSREGLAQGMASQALGDNINNLTQGLTGAYGNLTSGLGAGFNNLTGGFMDSLGRITSEQGQNAFNQGINQRLGALGLAPQIGQYNFLAPEYLQNIGGIQQGLEQQYRQSPLTFASQIQQLLGDPTVLSRQESKGVSQRGVSEGFSDIFGGGGGSMFGGMF